jgi:hypothetical protein
MIHALLHRVAEREGREFDEVRSAFKAKHRLQSFRDLDIEGASRMIDELQEYENQNGPVSADNDGSKVKEYVGLYAQIWRDVMHNRIFEELDARNQSIAVAGIFREIVKDRRTERIGELRNGNGEWKRDDD